MNLQSAESSLLSAVSCLRAEAGAVPRAIVLQAAERAMEGVQALVEAAKAAVPETMPATTTANTVFRCGALNMPVTRRLCVINQLQQRHACCNADCRVGVHNQQFISLPC